METEEFTLHYKVGETTFNLNTPGEANRAIAILKEVKDGAKIQKWKCNEEIERCDKMINYLRKARFRLFLTGNPF